MATLTLDGDVNVEDASSQGREIEGTAGARTAHCLLEFAGSVLAHSDARSETFNFAALRRMQILIHRLTSISATQVSLIAFCVRSRLQGLPPVRGLHRPWLLVAKEIGLY